MPQRLRKIAAGEPITDGWIRTLVDQVNALNNVRGDGTINVVRGPGSILLRANLPPPPRAFMVVQDAADGQGYVTAHWLRWDATKSLYTTDQDAGDQTIYDLAAGVSQSSYSGAVTGTSDVADMPFYGNSGTRVLSKWAKAGFLGDARWDASRGEWVIVRVEHIARFINFSYGGSGSYTFGQTDSNLSASSFWDGLDPTKTTFGTGNQANQIALVNSPDAGFKIGGQGNPTTGTAVWRDDMDNSAAWQYQVIDAGCATGVTQ